MCCKGFLVTEAAAGTGKMAKMPFFFHSALCSLCLGGPGLLTISCRLLGRIKGEDVHVQKSRKN